MHSGNGRASAGDRTPRRGTYRHLAWINPVAEPHWRYTHSIGMIRQLVGGRMYPDCLDAAMADLAR